MSRKKLISVIVIVAAIVVWVGLTWVVFRMPSSSDSLSTAATQNETSTSGLGTASQDAAVPNPAKPGTPATKATGAPSVVLAPAASAQWVFGAQNTIQWDRKANISGGIYVVNAANGSVVGWILEQTGPNQTSFSWNTRDVFLNRTSPTKKDIPAGNYLIKIAFDSPQDPTITSKPFSIIYSNQVQVQGYTVAITKQVFVPGSLTIKKGSKIVFTNSDAVSYAMTIASFGSFTVPADGSYTLDTTAFEPGPYTFYAASYPSLRMTVTVQ